MIHFILLVSGLYSNLFKFLQTLPRVLNGKYAIVLSVANKYFRHIPFYSA